MTYLQTKKNLTTKEINYLKRPKRLENALQTAMKKEQKSPEIN